MKKIFTLALICGSLLFGGFAVDAKKTVGKGKAKAKTTAAASSIRRNSEGYAMVSGHTYKANLGDGTSYVVTFKSNGTATMKLTAGKRSQPAAPGQWEQQGSVIGIFDGYSGSLVIQGEVSSDGKAIDCTSMYGENMTFKLVR